MQRASVRNPVNQWSAPSITTIRRYIFHFPVKIICMAQPHPPHVRVFGFSCGAADGCESLLIILFHSHKSLC